MKKTPTRLTEDSTAKLVGDSLRYLAGRADVPAITDVKQDGNIVTLADAFSGKRYKLTVELIKD